MAKQKSREIIANAEARSKELRRAANVYVDDVMKTTEESIAESLNTIRQQRTKFRQMLGSGGQVQSPAPEQPEETEE